MVALVIPWKRRLYNHYPSFVPQICHWLAHNLGEADFAAAARLVSVMSKRGVYTKRKTDLHKTLLPELFIAA